VGEGFDRAGSREVILPLFCMNKIQMVVVGGVICFLLLIGLGYAFVKLRVVQPVGQVTDGSAITAEDVVKRIGKLYDLTGENPQLAIVQNAEELRKKDHFFDKAQNGDLLLVTSKRAILYDPAKNMIIDVEPTR